jgi:hypothetical protein
MGRHTKTMSVLALFCFIVMSLAVVSAQEYKIFGGGLVITSDGSKTTFMYIFGIPFPPPKSLTVEGELLKSTTIRIEGYDKSKNLLLPAQDSPIPQGEPGMSKGQMQIGKWFTNAANVTWEFTKAGISFDTDDATYLSKKDGARIIFTKQEVRFDGVEKMPKAK